MKNSTIQNRSIYHDLLRIFASFAVICIHVCANSATWEQHLFSSSDWAVANVFNSLSRFAVPIFVMLSGSFMIERYTEGSLKKLYSKNILRLVTAFVFWSGIYVAYNIIGKLFFDQPLNIKALLYLFIQGKFHLWFIPMLIVLYAITPLVKQLCANESCARYFVIIACIPIVFNFINFCITIEPIDYLFKNAGFQFVSGYTVYYILGHYLTKYDICKKYRISIYIAAVTSLIITVLVSHHHYNSGHTEQHYVFEYLSPPVLLISIAVFLFFKYAVSKIRFREQTQKFIVKLSSLTFGIYLSHIVFTEILKYTPLTVESFSPIVSVPLIVLVVFIASAFTTMIISKIPVLKKYII